jgi:RNA polymerase sigma-70 factor (ECF subfamily)
MLRCCSDTNLADDLAQKVFLQVWLKLRNLREVSAFGGWLKKLAISIWLQHLRKNDALRQADELEENDTKHKESPGEAMDLDTALAALPETVRLCIVLSYNEGMSHKEIVEITAIPLGTVKSHINRGTQRLREFLSAYADDAATENKDD